MNEKCPKCGNIVVGEVQRSTGSKIARTVLKKGGMKATLAAAGSVIPGFGTVTGFLVGAGIDALYGDKINKVVDDGVDIFAEDMSYKFSCPKCGRTWHKRATTSQTYPDNSVTTYASSSRPGKYDLNRYSSKGPFNSFDQNRLYHALKELSSKKGGFTYSDIPEITEMGESLNLSMEEIYMIAMQCSWESSRPSLNQMINSKSVHKIEEGNTHIIDSKSTSTVTSCNNYMCSLKKYEPGQFKSTWQNILYAELFAKSYNSYGFTYKDIKFIKSLGESYNLSKEEIFDVALKCIWKDGYNLSKDVFFNFQPEKIIQGKYVEISYKLFNESDGDLLFETPDDTPERMIYGSTPNIVPGLFTILEGLSPGESFKVVLPPVAAFGEKSEDLIMMLDKELFSQNGKLKEEVKVGAVLPMMTADNLRVNGKIIEINTKIKMDFNHPFAGLTVRYEGMVNEVREANIEDFKNIGDESGCLFTDEEKEYLEEYRACLADDPQLSSSTRRLLNRMAKSLGLTEDQVNKLENLK